MLVYLEQTKLYFKKGKARIILIYRNSKIKKPLSKCDVCCYLSEFGYVIDIESVLVMSASTHGTGHKQIPETD